MPIVVAHVHPTPGRLEEVQDAYRTIVQQVHQEHGCELFALHTDGDSVLIVERWRDDVDLQRHAAGDVMAHIRGLIDPLLERQSEIWKLTNIPMGESAKGTIQ